MAVRLTPDKIKEKMKNVYNGEYTLISNYINSKTPITVRHKCGYEYQISKCERFFAERGYDCPKCRIPTKRTCSSYSKEVLIEKLESTFQDEYEYVDGEVLSSKSIVSIKHNKCGHIFTIHIHNLLNKNRFYGCPGCRENMKGQHTVDKNYLENALSEADDGNDYEWLETFHGSTEKHKIRHKVCGNEYFVQPRYFRYGDKTRCPECSRKKSKTENDLFNAVKEIIQDDTEITASNRSIINPYEIDIYIPKFKLGIELNGLYWHSEKHKDKKYHYEKMIKCNEKGVRLIQIYEDEWINHREIVLSKIRSALKIPSKKVVYARKSYVKDISTETELIRNFLDKNHIQGYVPSTYTYALFSEDDMLLSVACFNKLRNTMNSENIDNSYDLIRFASDIETTVIGGCSKIIASFVKNVGCKYIKTLADLRWSDSNSNMYIKMGFIEVNKVGPRYFYTDGHTRYSRFSFRKDKIKQKYPEIYSSELTEFEMMDRTSLTRIWDAGKITYGKTF